MLHEASIKVPNSLGKRYEGVKFSLTPWGRLLCKDRESFLEGEDVELDGIRIVRVLSVSDTELYRFPLLWNVEGAKEVIPDREDESIVFVPMTLCFAVMNLVLRGADKDRA